MQLSKNSFYKSWAPKLIFSYEFCNLVGLITSTKNVQKNFQTHFCDQFGKFLLNSIDMVKILQLAYIQ